MSEANDYRDVGGRATQEAKADDYRDVGGRKRREPVFENLSWGCPNANIDSSVPFASLRAPQDDGLVIPSLTGHPVVLVIAEGDTLFAGFLLS